jgi:hypothetical protein
VGYATKYPSPYSHHPPVVALGDVWDCAINGRPFRLDRLSDAFKQGPATINAIREQADNSALPGEQSITRDELWRAGQQSWHHGVGQRYRDKPESDPERIWASQGIDLWTKNQLTLLHDTTKVYNTATAAPKVIIAGDYLYLANGTGVYRSSNGTSWTSIPFASPTGTVTSLATNGFTVWACTPSQTYSTNTGTTTWTNWLAQPASGAWEMVVYVNNRLLVTNEQFICEVTGTATVTKLNPSEGNTAFRWTAITDGTSAIYAAGYAGHRSVIFSIRPPTDTPDGDLGVPVPAAPAMPTGEIVRSLYTYLGLLAIGTDKGVRVASKITDYAGKELLSVGQLIAIPSPILCFDGEGSYVYFGWTAFDGTHTGIGRLNLAQGTDAGVFAYASDLMAVASGSVTSITSFNDKRYFTVAGSGVWGETSSYVSSGWLRSGLIRHGLIDPKVAERVELRHASLTGSVGVSLSADEGVFNDLGTSDLAGTVTPTVSFTTNEISGTNFEIEVTLASSVDGSPVLQHVELRSAIVPERGDTFLVPLLLTESDRQYEARHPSDDFEALKALARFKHSAIYQEKSKVFNVIVQDYQFMRDEETSDHRWWNGTMILKCMAPAS